MLIFRDIFLSTLAAVFFAGTLAVSTASAAEIEGPRVQWHISGWGNKRAMTAGLEYVAQEAARRTGGNFKIKIHYGEVLSKARENLDGLRLGAFQGAYFCNFYSPGKIPAWLVFSLPFMPLYDPQISLKVRRQMLRHPVLVADLKRWNATPYMSALLPTYEFMGRGSAPMSLSNWKGKRVRGGGGLGDAMRKLGAVPTTLPGP